ncbi:MAG: hypothetical protein AAB700_00950 [Patescibacteria group bacterium]
MADFFGKLEGFYYTARTIFIILDVVFLVGFFIVLRKALKYRPDLISSLRKKKEEGTEAAQSEFDTERYAKVWEKILEKAHSAPPHSFTLAIMAADNLVGEALDDLGLEGEHIADKLQKLNPKELKTLENLWRAHRIRNDLVHTAGFEIKESEAKEILNIFESFLKELGVLK